VGARWVIGDHPERSSLFKEKLKKGGKKASPGFGGGGGTVKE